jgi:LysM repeat protein
MSQIGTIGTKKNSWTRSLVAVFMSAVVAALSLGSGPTQSALAAAPDKQAEAYTCVWYRVRAGDTLLEIAARYRSDVLSIRRVNGLRTTRIYTGQRLCIPRYYTPGPSPNPNPAPSGPWYAEYWNNVTQTGPAALVRNDNAINFNWGYGSPDLQRIQPDNFSGRWTRNINFSAGIWRFGFFADDGVRLTIDNQVYLDLYNNVGAFERAVDVPLTAGFHRVTIDYVERTGVAFITANIVRMGNLPPQPPGPPDNGKYNNGPWNADYFANASLTPPPQFSRIEPGLRFNWNGAAPINGFPGTFWSARFSQTRYFNPGVYQFVARVDDGIRIYINGVLVMNEFREQSSRTFTSNVKLGAGNYNIVVEYVQYGGGSDLSLYWDFLGNPDAPQPQVQVLPAVVGPVTYIAPLP